jgi:excisionase family DNA binding protein
VSIASDPAAGQDVGERLYTPDELGALFRVDPRTATRWAAQGRVESIKTPGGRWRFRESAVRRALGQPDASTEAGASS